MLATAGSAPPERRDAESNGRAPARLRRTPKASSKRQQLAAVVRELNIDRGIAVNSDEIAAALEVRFPDVAFDIGGILGSLTTSGDLIVVFGRPGCCRYAHRDTYTESVPPQEPILVTLRVVEEGCRRLRRDMATKEVTDAMRAAGIVFAHPNNYGLLLKNLSQPSERGALAWRTPRLACRTENDREGRSRVYWRPADADVPTERSPADSVDAATQAIEHVQALLGHHPVARADIALWSRAHAISHPVARYLEEHNCLSRGLEQLSEKRQARRVNIRARVRVVRTPMTVTGGAPLRYSALELSNRSIAVIELEDRLRLFTPARELASLRTLELAVGRGANAPVLQPILSLRTALLYDSILVDPISGEQPISLASVAADVKTMKERALEWTLGMPAMERYRRAMPYTTAIEEIQALDAVRQLAPDRRRRESRSDGVTQDLCVVGRGATATHLDLLPYAKVAERLTSDGYANPEQCRMLYYEARRVPNPNARWEKNTAGGLIPEDRAGQGWMLVDRVDALGLLWDAVHVPHANAVLSPARALLGFVLRDPRPLREALAITPIAQGAVRRSLVVGLGLLGESVDVQIAIPYAADALDTMAYVLSTVLVAPDRTHVEGAITAALERLQEAEGAARVDGGAARKVLTQASRRAASGMWLSVVG